MIVSTRKYYSQLVPTFWEGVAILEFHWKSHILTIIARHIVRHLQNISSSVFIKTLLMTNESILYIISEFVVSCRAIFDFVLRSSNVIFGLHYLKDRIRCMVQKKVNKMVLKQWNRAKNGYCIWLYGANYTNYKTRVPQWQCYNPKHCVSRSTLNIVFHLLH